MIDREGIDENPHLDYVLMEAARAVERFHAEGKTVLLQCVEAQSRTPSVAALYGARLRGVGADEALDAVMRVLPRARPNSSFREALTRLAPSEARL